MRFIRCSRGATAALLCHNGGRTSWRPWITNRMFSGAGPLVDGGQCEQVRNAVRRAAPLRLWRTGVVEPVQPGCGLGRSGEPRRDKVQKR